MRRSNSDRPGGVVPGERSPAESPRAHRDALITQLRHMLPAGALLHEAEDLRPYECDGLSAYRRLPMAVVLPRTVEQVQSVMGLCHTLPCES